MHRSTKVPSHLAEALRRTDAVTASFIAALRFVIEDTARDPEYVEKHILMYAAQDYLQSTLAIPLLAREGLQNVARRELRFLLEMSIKVCYIQGKEYQRPVSEKLKVLRSSIDSTSISIKRDLDLALLPSAERMRFFEGVGRLYGRTSGYVHWGTRQIHERIAMVESGRTSGYETEADVRGFNDLVLETLAACLVFLLHAVPEYVSGDLFTSGNDTDVLLPLFQSQYIAHIDEFFDYKHERRELLDEIREKRWAAVRNNQQLLQ